MNEQNWADRAIGWTWRGIMGLTLGILLFCQGWEYYAKVDLPWKNWICLPVGLAGLGIMGWAARMIMKPGRSPRRRRAVMGALSAAVAAVIYYCSAHYAFTPGWDPLYLRVDADYMAGGFTDMLSNRYFSLYPNNVLLTVVYSWIFRLAEVLGLRGQEYFVIHAFQCAGYGLVLYLIYACLEKMLKEMRPDLSLWGWMAGVLLIGISPWAAVQYTDSAALILVAVEGWLFLKIREGKRTPLWAGLLFLLGSLAWRIKPQTVILLIAAVLVWITGEGKQLLSRENRLWTLAMVCAAVLGIGAGTGIFLAADRSSGYNLDPEARFGLSHYLKMGLNEEEMGGYSPADNEVSQSAETRAERDRINWEIIRERLGKMGIGGLARQAVRKTLTNYGDGTFAWEQEGLFYDYEFYYFRLGNQWFYDHIPPIYIGAEYGELVEESHSGIWRTVCQCVWLGVLLLGAFCWGKQSGREVSVLLLSLLGLTLFELLFEARARYLFSYVPGYILAAGVGLGNLEEWIRKRRRGRKETPAEPAEPEKGAEPAGREEEMTKCPH